MKRAILTALLALVLAGCASLPTSGPVNSATPRIPEGYGVDVLAEGPVENAEPQDIVTGFLRASAYGHADDFSVASEYLAPGVSWDPLAQVRIFSAETSPAYATTADGGISVTIDQVAAVDSVGRYRLIDSDGTTSRFTLVRDREDQWRIAALEDGLLVSDANFRQTFGAASLFFLSMDSSATVPELRWYPLQDRVTHVVAGLLRGPSGWMEAGVTSAFPPGTTLAAGGVSVTDSSAIVQLSDEMLDLTPSQLALANAQLVATLGALGSVTSIEMRVGETTLHVPDFALDLALPPSAPGPIVLTSESVARYAGSSVQPIAGALPLTGRSPRDPAIPFETVEAPIVVIADAGASLLTVPTDGTPGVVLVSGTDLVAPSIDRYGWIWTASAADAASIITMRGDGTDNRIGASWLSGRELTDFRVAADGARAVVVSRNGTSTYVELVSITRDSQGRPRTLGEPLRIAESLLRVTDVSWVDQTSLVVLGSSAREGGLRVYRVAIGGPITVLPALEDAVSVASNRNERSVVVETADGYLYVRSGAGWRWVVTGIVDPAFSG